MPTKGLIRMLDERKKDLKLPLSPLHKPVHDMSGEEIIHLAEQLHSMMEKMEIQNEADTAKSDRES